MTKKDFQFSVSVYDSSDELEIPDRTLLDDARKVTAVAYAPYSKFRVGAMAILTNGKKVSGTNQENASFPVGICAERVLLSSVASQYPGVGILSIAISYNNLLGSSDHPVSPCGICRQSLCEYEEWTKQSIRLILSGMAGEVYVLERSGDLLPLSFGSVDLVKG